MPPSITEQVWGRNRTTVAKVKHNTHLPMAFIFHLLTTLATAQWCRDPIHHGFIIFNSIPKSSSTMNPPCVLRCFSSLVCKMGPTLRSSEVHGNRSKPSASYKRGNDWLDLCTKAIWELGIENLSWLGDGVRLKGNAKNNCPDTATMVPQCLTAVVGKSYGQG